MSGRSAPPDRASTADGVEVELVWTLPDGEPVAVAVVTHPHPLMGGDLHGPVPAGVARGLAEAGIAAVRLGFRGTGASGGEHGGGDAERADVVAAVDAAVALLPGGVPVLGVGYSFGADVLLAVEDDRLAAVVAIAPPLRILPTEWMRACRGGRPTLVLSPAHDQLCDPARAADVVDGWPGTTVEAIAGCDHFLVGAVARVVDRVAAFAAALS